MESVQFEGNSAREAEEFVATVNRIALREGKYKDVEWVAYFASSCFHGTALRWLADLNDEVTRDWTLLRRAILQRWPPVDEQAPIIAIAPAAAAPPRPLTSGGAKESTSSNCLGWSKDRLVLDEEVAVNRMKTKSVASPTASIRETPRPSSSIQSDKPAGKSNTGGLTEREKEWKADLEMARRRQKIADDAEARRRQRVDQPMDREIDWRSPSLRASGAYRPPALRRVAEPAWGGWRDKKRMGN